MAFYFKKGMVSSQFIFRNLLNKPKFIVIEPIHLEYLII